MLSGVGVWGAGLAMTLLSVDSARSTTLAVENISQVVRHKGNKGKR